MSKIYAVKVGINPGIYFTWAECEAQVKGYKGAIYKSFPTKEAAENWLDPNNIKNNITKEDKENKEDIKNKLVNCANILLDNEIISYMDHKEILKNINKKYVEQDYQNSYEIEFEDTCAIYSDGSYNSSNGECGYAAYIIMSSSRKIVCGRFIMENNGRNVEGEVKAIVKALHNINTNKIKNVIIYYDYEGIEKWATRVWKANTIYTKAYANFMSNIMSFLNIKFVHIKSHTGNIGNEVVDKLAKYCCNNSITSADKDLLNTVSNIYGFPKTIPEIDKSTEYDKNGNFI